MPFVHRWQGAGPAVPHRRFLLRAESAPSPAGMAREVLATSLWLGLLTGLLEIAVIHARGLLELRITADWLRMNRHYHWMLPAADTALVTALGLLLVPLVLVRPRLGGRAAAALGCLFAAASSLLASQILHPLAALVLAMGLTARLAPRLDPSSSSFRRLRRLTIGPMLVAAVAGGLWSHHRVETAGRRALAALPPAPDRAPNILLVVMDTVRADHLSTYGWPRPTSPTLSRLAAHGVRFAHARSTAPWTLPSHASLFTGRLPHELSVGDSLPLDATHPTLAEVLARRGYATGGFAANTYYCNSRFGLDRGFAHYEDYVETREVSAAEALRCSEVGRRLLQLAGLAGLRLPVDHSHRRDAAEMNRSLLAWLDGRPDPARPFFAFVNYFDAHDPYIPPPGFTQHLGTVPVTPEDWNVLHAWTRTSKRDQSERELTLARDAYDDCIAAIDDQLGRLLDELERRGALANTLIVVTADHGESFGEHQLFGHWRSLYRPELHVPLVVVEPGGGGPGIGGRVVEQPVSLRDVPATILDLAAPGAPHPLPGHSLAGFWNGRGGPADVPVSEVKLPARDSRGRAQSRTGPRAAIVRDGRTFIQSADGREELYDLAGDPDEAQNLAAPASARETLREFRTALEALVPPRSRIR